MPGGSNGPRIVGALLLIYHGHFSIFWFSILPPSTLIVDPAGPPVRRFYAFSFYLAGRFPSTFGDTYAAFAYGYGHATFFVSGYEMHRRYRYLHQGGGM